MEAGTLKVKRVTRLCLSSDQGEADEGGGVRVGAPCCTLGYRKELVLLINSPPYPDPPSAGGRGRRAVGDAIDWSWRLDGLKDRMAHFWARFHGRCFLGNISVGMPESGLIGATGPQKLLSERYGHLDMLEVSLQEYTDA